MSKYWLLFIAVVWQNRQAKSLAIKGDVNKINCLVAIFGIEVWVNDYEDYIYGKSGQLFYRLHFKNFHNFCGE